MVTHMIETFVGGAAKALCGKFVDNNRVTAFWKRVTCKKCKRGAP